MQTYERSLQALADPTRRALLERIADGPSTVGGLVDRFPISQPAVSQHLRILRDARLVSVEKRGTRRVYSVRKEGLEAVRSYLDRFWTDILDSFSRGVETDSP
jgi:DNA-binding transcriptional ArsR family regulator